MPSQERRPPLATQGPARDAAPNGRAAGPALRRNLDTAGKIAAGGLAPPVGTVVEANVDTGRVLSALSSHWRHTVHNLGPNHAIQGTGQPTPMLSDEVPVGMRDGVTRACGSLVGTQRVYPGDWYGTFLGVSARCTIDVLARGVKPLGQDVGMGGGTSGVAAMGGITNTIGGSAGLAQNGASLGITGSRAELSSLTATSGASLTAPMPVTRFGGTLVLRLRLELDGIPFEADHETLVEAGSFAAISAIGLP